MDDGLATRRKEATTVVTTRMEGDDNVALPEMSGGRRPATAAPLAGDRRSGGDASILTGRRPLGVCRKSRAAVATNTEFS